MASSSYSVKDLEDDYASIQIDDEEVTELAFDLDENISQGTDDRLCIVGRFLTGRAIDFDAMRHVMASLWQPGKGMYVKELEPNRYLFQFYHELDLKRVVDGSPWTFNRVQFVFERMKPGVDPRLVVINSLDIWVQIHGLQYGSKTEQFPL
ncbi:hypothetical protein G4B88_002649 [Cannabis sativa]|uniref:DUF4283 domain-containing protein n=1 Tax=Cannabis sativa TaxID=3483 RepID=A0A7J6I904_CANSA|nr:hypothetical protein G4B88_002649 [Cannabis sativa]